MDGHLINLLIAVISYFVCMALMLSRKKGNVVWICLLIPIVLNLVFWGSQYLTVPSSYRQGTDKAFIFLFGIEGSVLGAGLSFVAWIIGRWFNLSVNKTFARILLITVSLCVLGILINGISSIVIKKIEYKKYEQVRISPNISISPDDQHITFDYNNAIYVADINGANAKQITHPNEEEHYSPEFSIDGKKIFFWAKGIKDKKRQAMLVDFGGSNLTQLHIPANRKVAEDIALGVGEKVYYIAENYDSGSAYSGEEIFVVSPEGVEQRVTHLNPFNIYYLDISPDGRQLFFLTHNMGIPDRFWALSLDGKGEAELIIERKDDREMNFSMSPNGKCVTFTKPITSGIDTRYRYELFLMDNGSKKTIQLTHLNQNISFPRFYHHQDKIIFANDVNWLKGEPVYELWEINIDGTGLKKIDLSINKGSKQES